MLRLRWESLSPSWSEFVIALFRDLEPLGHSLCEDKGTFTAEVREASTITDENHWDRAHRVSHERVLEQHREEILSFERDFDGLFVDMATFQPSAVRPVLEVVDFKRLEHKRTVDYLRLMQSVTVRKLVGRRMGLLIWDVGQTGGTRLFGGAVLASARFSQRIRDQRFQWPSYYPKTSLKHDPMARAVRIAGLNRIMQLSMACAVPPYNVLSGAWLAAIAPFTSSGLDAFKNSHKENPVDADLAAIVTTTGKGASGSPFRGHRVAQIAPAGSKAAPDAKGDLYTQVRAKIDSKPLRASFEILLSEEARELACRLFREEQPERYASLNSPDRPALAFALRRLGLRRWLFDGNEIGVHLGILNGSVRDDWSTVDNLRTGLPRPPKERPLIDWETAVAVWSRKFLPAPELVGESADGLSKAAHREARQSRNERARTFPAEQIRLSHRLRQL